jgi:archaellum component FlaF (FlaF/FlaG flagellin family)
VNVNSDSNLLVTVTYSPTAVTTDTGTLFVSSDDPTNPVIGVSLTGSGSQPLLVVTTNTLNFGGIPVGSNSTLSVTVSNASAVRATINSIGITAGNANFTLDPSVTTSDVPLDPGAVEQVAVVYTATHQGADSGTLTIVSDGAVTPNLTVSLAGTGLQCNLNFSQSSLGFGSVALDTTNTLTVTITNTGNTNCTVDLVDVLGNGNFKVSAPSTPFSIAAGTNVDVDVEYVPVSSQTIVILGGAVKGSGNPVKITP